MTELELWVILSGCGLYVMGWGCAILWMDASLSEANGEDGQ